MTHRQDSKEEKARRQPLASAGLLFLIAGFGSFYGLISVVDPLL